MKLIRSFARDSRSNRAGRNRAWLMVLVEDGPDESEEFPGDSDDGFLAVFAFSHEGTEALVEPGLCIPTQFLDTTRGRFLTPVSS